MEKKMVIGKFATSFVVGIALISSGVLWPEAVLAQSYPTKNIRLIIPFVPGWGA